MTDEEFNSLYHYLSLIGFDLIYGVPALSAHPSRAPPSFESSSAVLTSLSTAELPKASSSSTTTQEVHAESSQRSTDQTLKALDSAHLSPSESIVQGFAARSEAEATTTQQRDTDAEAADETSEEEPDTYVSKVRILPTSLPHLWKEYMDEYKKNPQSASAFAVAMNAPHSTAATGYSTTHRTPLNIPSSSTSTDPTTSTSHITTSSSPAIASPSTPNPSTIPSINPAFADAGMPHPAEATTSDERRLSHSQDVERARSALRPHARPALVPSDIVKIDADKVPRTEKKPGQKWMFGIRSRNTAAEAIHCVYRALKGMGCMWEVEPGRPGDLSSTQVLGKQTTLPWNYVPPEGNLWSIRVVWQKDNMAPPGAPPNWRPVAASPAAREFPVLGREGVVASSEGGRRSEAAASPTVEGSIRVWNEIQVFESEGKETTKIYTVDIRCEGYEPFVVGADGRVVPRGWMRKEKDVTDPFPFIDFANRLIVELTS